MTIIQMHRRVEIAIEMPDRKSADSSTIEGEGIFCAATIVLLLPLLHLSYRSYFLISNF